MRARDHIDTIAGHAYNIGGGPAPATSLLELRELLEPIVGTSVNVRFEGWRTGDQRYYVSDTRRFAAATVWRPAVAVADGVQRLATWLIASGRLIAAERLAS